MRSLWSGYVGFGLVQMPVKLYKTFDNHDIGFHQHHGGTSECLGAVGMVRVCKDCGEVVDYVDIVKGIEHEGSLVIVEADELEQLQDEQGKQIDILQFVQTSDIDPLMYETAYYIGAPDGAKVYALLIDSMERSGLMAVAKFTMRSKTQLAVIRVAEGVLVLHTLLWADELRAPEVPGLGKPFSAAEAKAAHAVVQSMVMPFDAAAHHDEYRERLGELIEAKAGDVEFVARSMPEATEEVSDLLAQLEASVARKTPAKKVAAKKAPAKAAARKKKVA